MTITDGATTVFDSDQELLHLVSDAVSGTIVRDPIFWGTIDTPTERIDDIQIGTLPAISRDIIGLVKFEFTTGYSLIPQTAWFVAGGTILLEHKRAQDVDGNYMNWPSSIVGVTIYKSGTELRFKEWIELSDDYYGYPYGSSRMAGYTVTYKIFPATYS